MTFETMEPNDLPLYAALKRRSSTLRYRPYPGVIPLAFGLFDRQFRALEADAAVRAVAKRFVHRAAAAAESKGGLAG